MAWYELDLSKPPIPEERQSSEGDLRWPLAILGIIGCVGLLVLTLGAFFVGAMSVSLWSLGAFVVLAVIVRVLVRD